MLAGKHRETWTSLWIAHESPGNKALNLIVVWEWMLWWLDFPDGATILLRETASDYVM